MAKPLALVPNPFKQTQTGLKKRQVAQPSAAAQVLGLEKSPQPPAQTAGGLSDLEGRHKPPTPAPAPKPAPTPGITPILQPKPVLPIPMPAPQPGTKPPISGKPVDVPFVQTSGLQTSGLNTPVQPAPITQPQPKPATTNRRFAGGTSAQTEGLTAFDVDRVSSLPANLRQVYDRLDHQQALNDWNNAAFTDYLDMLSLGEETVDYDGVQMPASRAAKRLRKLLNQKKRQVGKLTRTQTAGGLSDLEGRQKPPKQGQTRGLSDLEGRQNQTRGLKKRTRGLSDPEGRQKRTREESAQTRIAPRVAEAY